MPSAMPAIEATETNDVKPVLPARLPSPASRKPICHSYGRFRNRFFTGEGDGRRMRRNGLRAGAARQFDEVDDRRDQPGQQQRGEQ